MEGPRFDPENLSYSNLFESTSRTHINITLLLQGASASILSRNPRSVAPGKPHFSWLESSWGRSTTCYPPQPDVNTSTTSIHITLLLVYFSSLISCVCFPLMQVSVLYTHLVLPPMVSPRPLHQNPLRIRAGCKLPCGFNESDLVPLKSGPCS